VNRLDFLLAAALAAASPRRAFAAAAGTPLVLVTADVEARVLAVDSATGALRKAIPTVAYPRSIETAGAVAVVAHPEVGAVTLIDTGTLSVTRTLHGFG